MSLGRLMSVAGAGAIGVAGAVMVVAAAQLLANAVRYMGAGGLELFIGWLLLLAATLALVAAGATLVGVIVAVRGRRRFPTVSALSGVALLAWSGVAGSSVRETEIVWLVASASGIGLLLLLGSWLITAGGDARP